MSADQDDNASIEERLRTLEQQRRGRIEVDYQQEVWQSYKYKPLRPILQMDCWNNVPAGNVIEPDENGLLPMCNQRWELRATPVPVRLQILGGTSREDALAMLRKLVDVFERFGDGDLAELEQFAEQRRIPIEDHENWPFAPYHED